MSIPVSPAPAPAAAPAAKADPLAQAAATVIDGLFLLTRVVGTHGPAHPSVLRAGEQLVGSIAATQPPLTLQFVGGGVFRDRKLVPLDLERFKRAQHLTRALMNLAAHEIAFERVPDAHAVVQLGALLSRGAAGPAEHELTQPPGIRLREIAGVKRGEDAEQVDAEVFVAAQIALGIASTEAIHTAAEPAWPWSEGLTVVRRLDRALKGSEDGTGLARRALETAPGEWTVPRRAMSATFRILECLGSLGVTSGTQRSAAHAMLALSLTGLEPREGLTLEAARERLLRRLLGSKLKNRTGIDPHRLMTTALVYGLDAPASIAGGAQPVLSLIRSCYALELRRCPKRVEFELSFVDVLAQGASDPSLCDPEWLKHLIHCAGMIPPGTRVQLADGSIGIALETPATNDPWYPPVLVGGQIVQPDRPVRVISVAAVSH